MTRNFLPFEDAPVKNVKNKKNVILVAPLQHAAMQFFGTGNSL